MRILFLPVSQAPQPTSLFSPDVSKMLPAVPGTAAQLSCSSCRRVFQEGQTAFQRKGSAELFCSRLCIDGCPLPAMSPAPLKRMCLNCSRYGRQSKAFYFAAKILLSVLVIIVCVSPSLRMGNRG